MHVQSSDPIITEETVMMKHEQDWLFGKVDSKHENTRLYILETAKGDRHRRKRKHLKPNIVNCFRNKNARNYLQS